MKYTIIIQQPKLIEFKINVNQGAILYLLCIAPLWADAEIINNKVYYWVSRQTIARELEAFQLKPDTIYRHLKKLHEKGLIDYVKVEKKDYIKLTKKGKKYLDKTQDNHYVGNKSEKDKNSETNPKKLGNKSEENSEINPTYQNTNNINKQDNIIDKLKKKVGVKKFNNMIQGTFIEIKYVIDFYKYRQAIKKPFNTIAPLKSFIKELEKIHTHGISIDEAIKIMQDSEWRTLKLEWVINKLKKDNLKVSDKTYTKSEEW